MIYYIYSKEREKRDMITTTNNLTEINISYLLNELRKVAITNNNLLTNFDMVRADELMKQAENYIIDIKFTSSRIITIKTPTFNFKIIVENDSFIAQLVDGEDILLIGVPELGQDDFETEYAKAVIKYINNRLG